MLRKTLRYVFSVAVVFPLVACTGASVPSAGSDQPPPGAEVASFHLPPPGTTFTQRITRNDGGSRTVTLKVLEPSTYQGKEVYRVSDIRGTNIRMSDLATGNYIGLISNKKETEMLEPDIGTYVWPLWVGRSWEARYTYHDLTRGQSWSPVVTRYKVAAVETVTVPAGTYKTFRLESSPGINDATESIIWWEPTQGIAVKRRFARLPSHYLGAGSETTELVELHLPGN